MLLEEIMLLLYYVKPKEAVRGYKAGQESSAIAKGLL
jgi:hypothetical protein